MDVRGGAANTLKDDLKTVTATVNGTPVEGFDPVNGGTFPVPAGTTSVDLAGIPEGWTATPMQDGLGFNMTSEDGSLSVEYVFQPETAVHTVSFDYGIEGMTGSQQVADGGKATEPVAPVRDGYTFDGWLLDGQLYDFATPVTGNITLTADWTINTYTVRSTRQAVAAYRTGHRPRAEGHGTGSAHP